MDEEDAVERFVRYPRSATVFAAVCCVLFIVVGVLGNLVTVVALSLCAKLRNATTAFVVSLCTADLFFCALNLPLTASRYIHEEWLLGDALCQLFPFFFYGNVAASLMSMTAITINRFILINHYHWYSRIYRKRYIFLMMVAYWAFSFGIMVPPLAGVWGRLGYHPETFSTVLSCIDCGKDFCGDEYKDHVKCITEDQKYGSKDFKAKVSSGKGETKQANWISNIKNYIATTNLPNNLVNLLNDLVKFNNIPRKKAKFQNFLNNSIHVRNPQLAEAAWDIFAKANQTNDSSDKNNQAQTKESVKTEIKTLNEVKITASENGTNELELETKKHKKKKNKDKGVHLDTAENDAKLQPDPEEKEVCKIESAAPGELVLEGKKRKKNKSKNKDRLDFAEEVGTLLQDDSKEGEVENGSNEITLKRKRHKKKKRKDLDVAEGTAEMDTQNIGEVNDTELLEETKAKRNKKRKKHSKNGVLEERPSEKVTN